MGGGEVWDLVTVFFITNQNWAWLSTGVFICIGTCICMLGVGGWACLGLGVFTALAFLF